MSDLRIENLTKAYRWRREAVRALRGVSLTLPEGAYGVIVGPSGCGKTTLLRIIAGLDAPDSGRVLLGGNDLAGAPPHRRPLAMVMQQGGLYPHMTVEENIRFGGVRSGPRETFGEANTRAAAVAHDLGIGPLLRRRASELSGGEARRVALAKALFRRPLLLLLDEPLSALDAPLRADLRALLRSSHRGRPITTLHVTHDQEEALDLADVLTIMHSGEVVQSGSADSLLTLPIDRFVASFLGAPPMNLLPGTILRGNEAATFTSGACVLSPPAAALPAGDVTQATLGLRPEHLLARPVAGAFTITRLRPWGGGALAECVPAANPTAGPHLLANAGPGASVGGRAELEIDWTKAHWFAPGDRGKRLG